MKRLVAFSCLFFLLFACTNEHDGEEPETILSGKMYQNFQIWGEEEVDEVTIRLQFHSGGKNGNAIRLSGNDSVYLDDTPVPVDSVKFNGVYYEIAMPKAAFEGEHVIHFSGTDGTKYSEKFSFEPFTLAIELAEVMRKAPFEIKLANFPEQSGRVRLVMVDTAMETDDVNEDVAVREGKLLITEKLLENLTEGPIYLEIYHEQERPVDNEAPGGGKILVNYAVKRQFRFVP